VRGRPGRGWYATWSPRRPTRASRASIGPMPTVFCPRAARPWLTLRRPHQRRLEASLIWGSGKAECSVGWAP